MFTRRPFGFLEGQLQNPGGISSGAGATRGNGDHVA
jgi:hypothetical protein